MNWKNLKINKCPKCDKDTAEKDPFDYTPHNKMLIHSCGFKISEVRYKEIVSRLVSQDLDREEIDRSEWD